MAINSTTDLMKAFADKGFYYSKDLIFNYYLSLITKPFVILTGISGSGKSKIAEIFAEIIGGDKKNYELVPVKPNWRDSKGLFGYHNVIDESYYITPLISLFVRALNDPENPYFLILDEMNIAKTEHYFADYLSIIESRRYKKNDKSLTFDTFKFEKGTTLSEAIILAAFDIGKLNQKLKVEEYRNNRFSDKWKAQIYGGSGANWTAQFRSELNQGENRLAYRVFEGGNGEYRLKDKEQMAPADREIVERLQELHKELVSSSRVEITQNNITLHNSPCCIGSHGNKCRCINCSYDKSEMYKCPNLYEDGESLVPPEMPIPLNVFTVGTVNVDETTYMFSPKVLDRSNVIEFNDVDFKSAYTVPTGLAAILNADSTAINNDRFYFANGSFMPKLKVSLPTTKSVNNQ